MVVLHVNWSGGRLWVWGEGVDRREVGGGEHPCAVDVARLRGMVRALDDGAGNGGELSVRLPTLEGEPMCSPQMSHMRGLGAVDAAGAMIQAWRVSAVGFDAARAPVVLAALEELNEREHDRLVDDAAGHLEGAHTEIVAGDSVRFFAVASRLAASLVAQQRVVPAVVTDEREDVRGQWRPWVSDEAASEKVLLLVNSMPASARSVQDGFEHDGAAIIDDFLASVVDAQVRATMVDENMGEAIEDWDSGADAAVAWLSGLLGKGREIESKLDSSGRAQLARVARRWLMQLEEKGRSSEWRLMLRLNEPLFVGGLADLAPPGDEVEWTVSVHLQSVEAERLVIDAEDVWSFHGEWATVEGRRIDQPQELLLGELARAARLFKPLEAMLEESTPVQVELSTNKAYEFLREARPILLEQGFAVEVPAWWDTPAARLGARLQLHSDERAGVVEDGGGAPGATRAMLGLETMVSYEWRLAVGDTPLSMAEFERLAKQRSPLVRVDGRWVEIRPEDVRAAVKFIGANPGGDIGVGAALRLAYATDAGAVGVPVLGIDATGWIKGLLDPTGEHAGYELLDVPAGFEGELRPYQQRGLSWLAFLDSIGLGSCLADDMGLGKTIQLLALMVHEREQWKAAGGEQSGQELGPTLLVVPMSIVGNWKREAKKFAPGLRVMVHHGPERRTGEAFLHAALESDLVVTTYALAHRDSTAMEQVRWRRLVLDEAQNVKNPHAKQSQAVRRLEAPRRITLTGTPLENRLSELWSIMDFCNPGLLGSQGEFRRLFGVPIERHRDPVPRGRLRELVRPFILRRLKTDPKVISDLPDKVETKEYCRLTREQASLYEDAVKTMLAEVERTEGIQRRGMVLTTLVRLKQICNHPSQLVRDVEGGGVADAARSGKCIRILEMLDEVLSEGAKALVFTQFRQMGDLLAGMMRHAFDQDVLFLHGGTPNAQREKMIERFQSEDGPGIFVLSLKAGGVGLNLTAASHVFHFDRWWNPAVENQATDRAFRIGQTKSVQVHKFVVGGTLEERIDEMIESKIALAEDVIGAGEDWLTEMSVSQLRDVLALRPDALDDEGE
ncbi:MAG: DEAD/DEAH box helicase [Phycisphaeraceae bacterium]|nr:DEAD/DEAH box helicase [Phycisphaeraceae bacterium]